MRAGLTALILATAAIATPALKRQFTIPDWAAVPLACTVQCTSALGSVSVACATSEEGCKAALCDVARSPPASAAECMACMSQENGTEQAAMSAEAKAWCDAELPLTSTGTAPATGTATGAATGASNTGKSTASAPTGTHSHMSSSVVSSHTSSASAACSSCVKSGAGTTSGFSAAALAGVVLAALI